VRIAETSVPGRPRAARHGRALGKAGSVELVTVRGGDRAGPTLRIRQAGATAWPAAGWMCRTSPGALIDPHRGRRARRRSLLGSSIPFAVPYTVHATTDAASVLHPWTIPSSTPSATAGVRMRDLPARRFVCVLCRAPVLVCSHCDRGQIYCATGCAATARRQSQGDTGRRYQDSLPGRLHHAARTQRWPRPRRYRRRSRSRRRRRNR